MKKFLTGMILLLVMALLAGAIYHAEEIRTWFAAKNEATKPAEVTAEELEEPTATPVPTATTEPTPAPTAPAASTAPTATPAPTQEPAATPVPATEPDEATAEVTFGVTGEFVNVFAGELPNDISLSEAVRLSKKDGVIYNVVDEADTRIVCRLAEDERVKVPDGEVISLPVNNGKLVTRMGTDACTKNAGEMHLPGFDKAKRAVAKSSTWSYEANYHWFGEMPANDVATVFAIVKLEDGRHAIALVVYGNGSGSNGGNGETPEDEKTGEYTDRTTGGVPTYTGNGESKEQEARKLAEAKDNNGEVETRQMSKAETESIFGSTNNGETDDDEGQYTPRNGSAVKPY